MGIILSEAKKIAITLAVMDVLIVVVALLSKKLDASVIIGIIYGFIFALLNFILLGTVVSKALTMDEKHAKHHMRVNYAIRFVLLAIILAIPFISGKINGWVVAISMLSPKITYFTIGYVGLLPFKKKNKE